MAEREYLIDVIEQRECIRVDNMINLIVAPCGCGKTTYITKKVVEEDRFKGKTTLFVVDSNTLEEQLINREEFIPFRDESQIDISGIYVCTYHRLGRMLALEEVTKKNKSEERRVGKGVLGV